MTTLRKKIIIFFWKTVARLLDLRPRKIPSDAIDLPIAYTEDLSIDRLEYPEGIVVLYEWEEHGKKWIAFVRN